MRYNLHQASGCAQAQKFQAESGNSLVLRNVGWNTLVQQAWGLRESLCDSQRRYCIAGRFRFATPGGWSLRGGGQGNGHEQGNELEP
jgi:hypothetical protein